MRLKVKSLRLAKLALRGMLSVSSIGERISTEGTNSHSVGTKVAQKKRIEQNKDEENYPLAQYFLILMLQAL
jgi:hypothetical protein